MVVHLRAEELAVILPILAPAAYLRRIERLPLDILRRDVLDTKDPSLRAVPDGVPLIITGEPAVRTVLDVARVELVRARAVEIRVAVVQAQSEGVVLEVSIRAGIVREETEVLGEIDTRACYPAIAAGILRTGHRFFL